MVAFLDLIHIKTSPLVRDDQRIIHEQFGFNNFCSLKKTFYSKIAIELYVLYSWLVISTKLNTLIIWTGLHKPQLNLKCKLISCIIQVYLSVK